jgi:pimeloyl-ACP methyl ester carboxylesterase
MSLSMVHSQKSTIGRADVVQKLMRGLSTVAPGLASMAAEQLFVTVFPHKRPRREDVWADGASRISIPSPHGDLAAWVWGDGPKTVLLVHGWAGRGLQLGAFVEPLADAGYRVVAYDGPAHGESPGRRTNIFKLTEGLMAVADAIGPVSGVIAHSLGTTAVLLAASRFGFKPDRFIAVSPMASTRTMTEHYSRMTGFSPAVVEEMRARLERSVGFRWDEIEPLNLASAFETETLVIHDHDDLELPASEGEALARRMPAADTVLTEGLGHRRILRDPAVVAAAMDFIVHRDAMTGADPVSLNNAASAA